MRFSSNKEVRVVQQDKGNGLIIMDKSKYVEKCMVFLNSKTFKKVDENTLKQQEKVFQKSLLKVKNNVGEKVFQDIYPTVSHYGEFYCTAKVHKVKEDDKDKLDKLPLRPIILNNGTSRFKTAEYLCNLIAPLDKSRYTISSTKEFLTKIKEMEVPHDYQMISFDAVNLYTKLPLQKTVDIILRKIYDEKLIPTHIKRCNMKELLFLCTKGVPFTFYSDTYVQIKGVTKGSKLGDLFANIFITEIENTAIPKLADRLKYWTRYDDDCFAIMKTGSEAYVMKELNSYHGIKFMYENETNNKLSFLDVLVTRLTGSAGLDINDYNKIIN